MASKKADTFANVAAVYVLESAATTQTSKKFDFPFSIMDKMALIINRIEYWMEGHSGMNTSLDRVIVALSAAANLVDINTQSDPLIIDSYKVMRLDIGTAASGLLVESPFIKDFSAMPGGGLLVAPNPLYAVIEGIDTSTAMAAWVKLFYTYIELGTDEYWQLVESRRVITG